MMMAFHKSEAQSQFIYYRSEIHEKFHHVDYMEMDMKAPFRNQIYGATDALLDTEEMLMIAKNLHIKSEGKHERSLIAYGILNALYVQQDSVGMLAEIILNKKFQKNTELQQKISEIRTLRNRLAGHPAYAERNGNTSSIPGRMLPGRLVFQIYGLEDDKAERFIDKDIDQLIEDNYAGLVPEMKKISEEMKTFLDGLMPT